MALESERGDRVVGVITPDGITPRYYRTCDRDGESDRDHLFGDWPDLTDPATLGCLLALVREAWGDTTITTMARPTAGGRHAWWTTGKSNTEEHDTEAEALVAALEAAP